MVSIFDTLYKNKKYDIIIDKTEHTNSLTLRDSMILQSSYYKLLNSNFDINSFGKAILNTNFYDSIAISCIHDFLDALQNSHNHKCVIDTWETINSKLDKKNCELQGLYFLVAHSYFEEKDYNNYILSMQCVIDITAYIDSCYPKTFNFLSAKFYATICYNKLISIGLEEQARKYREKNEKYFLNSTPIIDKIDWTKFSFQKDALDSLLYLIESTSISFDERQILLDSLFNTKPPHNKYPQISEIFFKNNFYYQAIETYKRNQCH